MARLIAPKLTCPECDAPLEKVETRFATVAGKVQFDDWRAISTGAVISCAAGHSFEAIYEQREPWLSVLVGYGAAV